MLRGDLSWLLPPRASSNSFGAEDASGARPPRKWFICERQNSFFLGLVACNKVITEIWVVRVARIMQSDGRVSEGSTWIYNPSPSHWPGTKPSVILHPHESKKSLSLSEKGSE